VWGFTQAIADLRNSAEPYIAQLKSGETQNGVLLRTFEKGILFRDIAGQRVEFLEWPQIINLYRSAT
jgi:hypothetical protein